MVIVEYVGIYQINRYSYTEYRFARILYSLKERRFLKPSRIEELKGVPTANDTTIKLYYNIESDEDAKRGQPYNYVLFEWDYHTKSGKRSLYITLVRISKYGVKNRSLSTSIEYRNKEYVYRVSMPEQIRDFVYNIENNHIDTSTVYSKAENDFLLKAIRTQIYAVESKFTEYKK